MNEQAQINSLLNEIAGIKALIKQKILSLPDNPRIERLSSNSGCFTISSKDLGNNWSPSHHDFKATYRIIIKEMESKSAENIIPFLQSIVEKGKFRVVAGNYIHRVHEDIKNHLRKII